MKKLIVIIGISWGLGRVIIEEFINLGYIVIGCVCFKFVVENLIYKYFNLY